MKIVFLLQVHQGYEQVCTLVEYLIEEKHYCVLHVDAKSDNLFYKLTTAYKKNKNIFFVTERESVYWSHISQVRASLLMMKLLQSTNIVFDRIQLMSGEDVPVHTMAYLEKYLEKNKKKEFMTYQEIGDYEWRLKRYCILTDNRLNRTSFIRSIQKISRLLQGVIPKRHILQDKVLYKGSSWFNLSYDAFIYILCAIEENKSYMESFDYSACADEHFFQILLLNSPYKNQIVNHNLYAITIEEGESSPRYLSLEDIVLLKKKKDIFFTRKCKADTTITYLRTVKD